MLNRINDKTAGRVLALLMAVMIGVTFMPVLDHGVKAAAATDKVNSITKQIGKSSSDSFKKIGASSGEWCKVTTNVKAQATITGHVNDGKIFAGVCVDSIDESNLILSPSSSGMMKSDINVKISLMDYSVGFHTLYVIVAEKLPDESYNYTYFEVKDVARSITDKPTYKGKFDVYSKYFFFYPYSSGWSNTKYDLYLEYKLRGSKKWKRTKAMRYNMVKLPSQHVFKFKGLKPNRKYNARIRYGTTETNSAGQDRVIFGPAKYSLTFKSGMKRKVKIKKITVKAVNVKFHKVRHPGYWSYVGGYAFWHNPYTEKYYTYKIKVTVKLKKKPSAKGLWINGKYRKGNKKKYTVKFSPYPNYSAKRPPKGFKKFKLAISSYQNKKYGGFAPLLVTKRKVR